VTLRLLPRSLQARLQVLILGLATLVWLGAAVTTWFDAQHELDELLDGHLTQSAALLVLQADDRDDDISDVPVLHKYVPQVAFQVFIGGRLVTRSSNVSEKPLSNLAEGFATVYASDGQQWRVFATYNKRRDTNVVVGEKVESRQAILWAIMRSMLGPLLFCLPLFGLAVWWAVRVGLVPIRDLRRILSQRQPHAVESVPLDGMPPELQPLVHALNELLGRIGHMVESERRFTADAAHELRTPIAAIRAQAQVALGAGDNVPEREHALHQTVAGCDRAVRLVEQLLTLARLDALPDAQSGQVDLGVLVQRIADKLRGAAQQRSQVLNLHLADACRVPADEVLLGVLVRNLLDNALRYSPDGATVQVDVGRDVAHGHGVFVQVQDSGPGMTEEAISNLGKRFFRVLGTDQTGSGLGWSIVSRLVRVFGTEVAVGRAHGLGGLSVLVRWPVPPLKISDSH
jgi:two-component system sensor histidine kinase QseC